MSTIRTFLHPRRLIAVDPASLIVADAYTHSLYEFNLKTSSTSSLVCGGSEGRQLDHITSLCLSPGNLLLVSDSAGIHVRKGSLLDVTGDLAGSHLAEKHRTDQPHSIATPPVQLDAWPSFPLSAQCGIATKYATFHYLNYQDSLVAKSATGFIDGGHVFGRPEAIVVDAASDAWLRDCTMYAQTKLRRELGSHRESKLAGQINDEEYLKIRFHMLSQFVNDMLGGASNTVTEQFASLKLGPAEPLGRFLRENCGLCRHRALFFKYLCDHTCHFPTLWGASEPVLPCRLIRGDDHAWNVVLIGKKHFVVDTMNKPGAVMRERDAAVWLTRDRDLNLKVWCDCVRRCVLSFVAVGWGSVSFS